MRETDLYPPVKAYLERQGYAVKAEVNSCDVVALRGDEPPVIVELKLGLTIALLLQGVDRQALSDAVYVAFAAGKGPRWKATLRDAVKLCRRLGLGLISVRPDRGLVEVHCDPGPYQPRKNARRRAMLLREFERRAGDPNRGGQTGRPVVTAYRQDALRLALAIKDGTEGRPAALKRALGVEKAASILSKDYYGWFIRLERGVYGVSDKGVLALQDYAEVCAEL
jgi:hypothetical protein